MREPCGSKGPEQVEGSSVAGVGGGVERAQEEEGDQVLDVVQVAAPHAFHVGVVVAHLCLLVRGSVLVIGEHLKFNDVHYAWHICRN